MSKRSRNTTDFIDDAIDAVGERLQKMQNAIKVVLLTPHIREYLQKTDPKALQQLKDAIE